MRNWTCIFRIAGTDKTASVVHKSSKMLVNGFYVRKDSAVSNFRVCSAGIADLYVFQKDIVSLIRDPE